jgi:hypothetical protein
MSHRNSAHGMTLKSQFALVSGLVSARQIAIVLVLVLLITNGGAG